MAECSDRKMKDAASPVVPRAAEADNRLGVLVIPATFDAMFGNLLPHLDPSPMSGVCRDETVWYARESSTPRLLHVPAHVMWEGWGIVRYDNGGERHNACLNDFASQGARPNPLPTPITASELPHFIQATERTAASFPAAEGDALLRNAAAFMSNRINDQAYGTLIQSTILADSDDSDLGASCSPISFSRSPLMFARSPNPAARMKGVTARHGAINPDAIMNTHECRCLGQTSRVRRTSQRRLAQWWPSAQIFSRCSTERYEGGVES